MNHQKSQCFQGFHGCLNTSDMTEIPMTKTTHKCADLFLFCFLVTKY